MITGDFNAQEGEKCLDTFLYQHELKSLNKEATYYKNPNKPSCIDLILTNSPRSFFNTVTYFTGLSDCHKLVLSVFKTTFSKTRPKEMMYRDYKNFDKISSAKNFAQAYPQKQYLTIPVLKRIS